MKCPYCDKVMGSGAVQHVRHCPLAPGRREEVVLALHDLSICGVQPSRGLWEKYAKEVGLPGVKALLSVFHCWDGVAYWSGLVPHSILGLVKERRLSERSARVRAQVDLVEAEAEYAEWVNRVPYIDGVKRTVKPCYDPRRGVWRDREVVSIR